jgi:hypothetical protein
MPLGRRALTRGRAGGQREGGGGPGVVVSMSAVSGMCRIGGPSRGNQRGSTATTAAAAAAQRLLVHGDKVHQAVAGARLKE